MSHVLNVPGNQCQPVLQSRGGEQCIHDRGRVPSETPDRSRHDAPPPDNGITDRESTALEPVGETVAGYANLNTTRVIFGQVMDALFIFSQCEDAQEELPLVHRRGPTFHGRRPSGIDQCRHDIGIEQPSLRRQRSTSRPMSRSRTGSKSSPPYKLSRNWTSGWRGGCGGMRSGRSSAAITTTGSRPRVVTVCGPSVRARRTTSLKRAFASSSFQVAPGAQTILALRVMAASI